MLNMEWLRHTFRHCGLLGVLYLATVIELSFPRSEFVPSWMALAVTLALSLSPPTSGVFWAAAGGFILDATSPGPLGPLLMAYGLIASGFVGLAPSNRRTWWFAPTIAFALAAIHPVVLSGLMMLEGTQAVDYHTLLLTAFTRGGTTAFAATVCALLFAILQRLLSPSALQGPLPLTNRWTMLTE